MKFNLKKLPFKGFLSLSLLIFLSSCSTEEAASTPEEGPTETLTFEEVIALGGDFDPFPQSRTEEVVSQSEPFSEDYSVVVDNETVIERFICTTETVSVLDGNGQFPLFNTSADVIYPGSLLQGKTLGEATPAPIVVERAGGTVSYNLINGNPNSFFQVEEVSKSSIQNAMNNIILGSTEAVPANFQLEIVQIESESQLALELGIEVETFTTQVASSMSFSSEQSFNRTLVKLNQAYYTMSFDLPTSLEQIFDPNVTPEQLAVFVQEDNPATFISSVTYGRIFYMLIESTSSREDMQAKLNLAYGAFNNNAEGDLAVSALEELDNLKIKVIAYGGDSAGAFQLTGETNVADIANKLAESTDIRAGLPLSYVVRSVERPDQIVGTSLATEYDIVDCQLKGVLPPQTLLSLVDLFANDQDGGGIGAMLNVSASNLLVFNKLGNKYAWYNGNSGEVKGIFSIDDENAPLGIVPLDDVGAAHQLKSNALRIIDKSGIRIVSLDYDEAEWSGNGPAPTSPIGSYNLNPDSEPVFLLTDLYDAPGGIPISGDGIEAAVRVGGNTFSIFAKPGSRYANYSRLNDGSWGNPVNSNNWYNNLDHSGPDAFANIGAVGRITLGNNTVRWLMVNAAGDEIMEYSSAPSRLMRGPWVVN